MKFIIDHFHNCFYEEYILALRERHMTLENLRMRGISRPRSHAEVFLRKGVLKICSKFAGEHPCRSVISIKMHIRTSAWLFIYFIYLLKFIFC